MTLTIRRRLLRSRKGRKFVSILLSKGCALRAV
jgi:hypothetical protein